VATGTATLDFGSTPTDVASVVVTGQAGIVSGSLVEAWFMQDDTTADNGSDEHNEASAMCQLVCGAIVAATGFTIFANTLGVLGIGTFKVKWAWT